MFQAIIFVIFALTDPRDASGETFPSIGDAIRTTKSGAAVHDKKVVTVDGVVSAGTGTFFGARSQKIFIQDHTAGISLFSTKMMTPVRAGDRVRATGKLKRFNGALEIAVSHLTITGHGAPPEAIAVQPEDLLGTKYTGRLVQITSTVVGSRPSRRSLNVSLQAGTQVVVMHLSAEQLKRFPPRSFFADGMTIRVVGIATQYDRVPPHVSGWQILPRAPEDITVVRGAPLLTVRETLIGAAVVTAVIILCLAAVLFLRRQVALERKKVAASAARYSTLFERSVAGLYTTTVDGVILDCNDAVASLLGCTREALLGQLVRDYYCDPEQVPRVARALRENGSVADLEIALRRCDGGEVWVLATATMVETPGQNPVIDGAMIDITARRQAIEQMEFLAYHDALTGLPNRVLFRDRVDVQTEQAHREASAVAVLFLDIDRFKRINDSLGHSSGDELLKAIAARLRDTLRAADTVARLGGDEFAILARSESIDAAGTVARKALTAIQQPFAVADHVLHITASIGVALFPADGNDCGSLLRAADRAMYRGKELGRNTIEFASSHANAGLALDRLSLENDLRRAMHNGELEVWYQPQVNVLTGEIVGAEALARWAHPHRGYVPPDEFITIAEEIGVIDVLGEWVLEQACRASCSWKHPHPGFTMSVNVSSHQLRDVTFPEKVAAILEATGVSPSLIELEVTESAALSKQSHTLAAFSRLHELGVRISIDDFGTGHATFTNVLQLPVSTIKIDSSFVSGIGTSANDATIVSSVISMAHQLSCRAVAEGVENETQLNFLRSRNCDAYQGFLFSRAIRASEFEQLLIAARGEESGGEERSSVEAG